MPADEEIEKLARRFVYYAFDFDRASPLYASIARACAADRELLALFCEAPPDQQRPTLPLAAVHRLVLHGTQHRLAEYYPSAGGTRAPDDDTFPAFRDFCLSSRDALVPLLRTRNTQTNEVRRSAQLMPALGLAARGRPLALIEVGPSAGLNLILDRYRFDYGDGVITGPPGARVTVDCELRGALRPPDDVPSIACRVGIDEQPIDVRDDDAIDWLDACIWPEQADRRALLRAAVAEARLDPPPLVGGDAVDLLADELARAPRDAVLCVMHSFINAYVPADARAALETIIREAAREREVAWVTAEPPNTVAPLADAPSLVVERQRAVLAAIRGEGPHTEGFSLIGLVRFEPGREQERRWLAMGGHHGHWLEWIDEASAARQGWPAVPPNA